MSNVEPPFVAKPGQVDFSDIRWCPVMNCVLVYQDKILIVKRSSGMRLHPNCWNGISGFLDDYQVLEDKVREEVREETGLVGEQLASIELRGVFVEDDVEFGKTWVVHAIKVEVTSPDITLDWEATEYKWIAPGELQQYDLLPGFAEVVDLVVENPHKYTLVD